MARAAARLLLPDLAATRTLAARLGALLTPGDVVLLEGDLGAGKTELARAVIRALAGAPLTVPSPTFSLVQHYELPGLEVGHADLYRLGSPAEVAELDLEECWRQGALLVEWPDRAPELWPDERLTVALAAASDRGPAARWASLLGTGRWADRVPALAAGGG